MPHLLILCQYNRSVSKMAAAYLERKFKEAEAPQFTVASAGFTVRKGDSISDSAVAALAELGLTSSVQGASTFSLKEIKLADLIICTTEEHTKKLLANYRSAKGKVIHLMTYAPEKRDVFEPKATLESHRQCLNMMKPALDKIAEKLLQ